MIDAAFGVRLALAEATAFIGGCSRAKEERGFRRFVSPVDAGRENGVEREGGAGQTPGATTRQLWPRLYSWPVKHNPEQTRLVEIKRSPSPCVCEILCVCRRCICTLLHTPVSKRLCKIKKEQII